MLNSQPELEISYLTQLKNEELEYEYEEALRRRESSSRKTIVHQELSEQIDHGELYL